MSIYKTIGGDRLGSGNKMKTKLHNYERSTHNLGNVWRSTMSPGTLVPFYKKLALNGDTWSINLKTMVRTMPAIGPLFGTYKLQMDVFSCPIRLYNGILHNNWVRLGLDVAKVKIPKIKLTGLWKNPTQTNVMNMDNYQISSSCLMAYLGVRGIGGVQPLNAWDNDVTIEREFNAVPMLAYYDIFKNYYSNKQEKLAQVIGVETEPINEANLSVWGRAYEVNENNQIVRHKYGTIPGDNYTLNTNDQMTSSRVKAWKPWASATNAMQIYKNQDWKILYTGTIDVSSYEPIFKVIDETGTLVAYLNANDANNFKTLYYPENNLVYVQYIGAYTMADNYYVEWIGYKPVLFENGKIKIESFDLENLDRMRQDILKNSDLGVTYITNSFNYLPYKVNSDTTPAGNSYSKFSQVGLMLKTYQSDLYNNWLSREYIDGLNGIAAVTSVDTSGGSFTMDTLNLAQKVYNMLNRIVVSGGSYQDWQEAVYGEDAVRMVESPIYCGGMSATIAFEEVVSTADTDTEAAGDQPLGSLAGKGTITNAHGGHIEIHVKEPSYIIGIVSITPYIDYCQGNDFDMTELDSINDLHKPALDGIGFQNLMLEQAAWWGTEYNMQNNTWIKNVCGKVPAWINYMTSVNQVYGNFADKNNLGFMCLTRRYEYGQGRLNGSSQIIPVKDFTTYINPTKYNYQFADNEIEAQNFWVQIGIDATSRRKMSAKIIPNL